MPLRNRALRLTTDVVGTAAGRAGALVGRFQRGVSAPGRLGDPALMTKVQSTIYRLPGVSRSKVDVAVADGVVTLDGEVRSEAYLSSLHDAVDAIPEVKGVESRVQTRRFARDG